MISNLFQTTFIFIFQNKQIKFNFSLKNIVL